MSASGMPLRYLAGAHKNRYEGGLCYAACMETFTLYAPNNSATTHRLRAAGRVAIYATGRVNDPVLRKKQRICASAILRGLCGLNKESWRA